MSRCLTTSRAFVVFALLSGLGLHAAPPPDLPGEDITQEYAQFKVARDSSARIPPRASPLSHTWFDQAMRSWEAPTIDRQLTEDQVIVPLGKGAIFVPRFSRNGREPDIEILDHLGETVTTGKAGRRFTLMPGTYSILVGSGTRQQRISRTVEIEEGRTLPLVPDWAGLLIEVVDESNIPFRGEYEIARIDEFEAFGRGTGRDPNVGEDPDIWVLKPGIYKIFGVGQSYNTPTNFVTVRLLPGEFIRFTVVQNNEREMKITGGGIVYTDVTRRIASNWKFGGDIGGSLLFNNRIDHKTHSDSSSSTFDIELLSTSRLNYRKDPLEWDTRLWIKEKVSIRDFNVARLSSDPDDIRLASVHTWRFLPWLGPYGRLEMETRLFPVYEPAPATDAPHHFVVLDKDSSIINIQSGKTPYQLRSPFSTFRFQTGFGANMNIYNGRYLESRLLAGFGYTQETRRDEATLADSTYLDRTNISNDPLLAQQFEDIRLSNDRVTFLRQHEGTLTRPEFGPEAVLSATLRLAHLASIESELKLFAPVDRYGRGDFTPDVYWWSRLSWRLMRQLTLDYQYEYRLRWPDDELSRINQSIHGISIRFSYSSR